MKTHTPSDQDFVRSFSDLSQNHNSVTLKDGVLQREDEYQMVGVYCPDCRGEVIAHAPHAIHRKPEVSWCFSDQHPIFDSTGRIVQMSRPA